MEATVEALAIRRRLRPDRSVTSECAEPSPAFSRHACLDSRPSLLLVVAGCVEEILYGSILPFAFCILYFVVVTVLFPHHIFRRSRLLFWTVRRLRVHRALRGGSSWRGIISHFGVDYVRLLVDV